MLAVGGAVRACVTGVRGAVTATVKVASDTTAQEFAALSRDQQVFLRVLRQVVAESARPAIAYPALTQAEKKALLDKADANSLHAAVSAAIEAKWVAQGGKEALKKEVDSWAL